uniref:Importin subunit alpha n=1 Tax=Mucochytrium quahogii TaxID=96639 RepID=A0A7S2RHN7_9STRA|mmetsp:Transcript_16126/g.27763  ORF Transcript_16126/g.27763 Transcript_16126/m.27763 type:complete len:601 (-) Transcript_16126:3-1805(-)
MRMERSVQLRKSRRAVSRAKRRASMEAQGDRDVLGESYTRQDVLDCLGILERELSMEAKGDAIRRLKRWLALPQVETEQIVEDGAMIGREIYRTNEVVLSTCAEKGLTAALVSMLDSASQNVDEELTLDAVWCITNIASGSAYETSTTLCAAPQLIRLLNCGHQKIQEQSFWALGNMAGEDQKPREELLKMGILAPLMYTLRLDSSSVDIKRVATWCLSNLVRGSATSAIPFFEAKVHETLLNMITHDVSSPVLVEVVWCLSFLSAKEVECSMCLVDLGILEILGRIFVNLVAPSVRTEELDIPLITPVLRTISNIVALPKPRDGEPMVVQVGSQPGLFDGVSRLLSQVSLRFCPALTKEGLWMVSNCCALGSGPVKLNPGSMGVIASPEQLLNEPQDPLFVGIAETFLDAVCWHFSNSPLDIQKEAAFALFNLASRRNPDALIKILRVEPPVLPVMLSLLKAPDLDVVRVALEFIEIVLAKLSNPFGASKLGGRTGAKLVEMFDGIDALEVVAYNQNLPSFLIERASELVDKYFGEDYEDEEEDQPREAFRAGVQLGVGRGRAMVQPAWMSNLGSSVPLKQGTLDQFGFVSKDATMDEN